MGFGDLFGDREAEARMGAELLFLGTFGIEAVEDGLQLVGRDAGAVILDRDHHFAAQAPAGQDDRAARRAEGERIGQEVAYDLAEPRFQAQDIERIVGIDGQADRDRASRPRIPVNSGDRVQCLAHRHRAALVARQFGIQA